MTGFIKTDPNRTRTESYTLALPRCTKHMAKDGQVCFHRRHFSNPVNPQRCITKPWNLWMALIRMWVVLNYSWRPPSSVLWSFCTLLKIRHYCLCPSRSCNPHLASHPPPPSSTLFHPLTHAIRDITVMKIVAQKPVVLAS